MLFDRIRESDKNVYRTEFCKNKGGVPALIHPVERKHVMKKIISILCILSLGVGLSACNTFKGFGQDMERGGEKVQDAASGAQRK